MANVAVTSDAWTEISITSGTIQNISATADIELSAEQTDNSGVVLKPSELYQWDNETIYARAVTEETGALRVVNFKRATGGGSSVAYSTTEQKIGTWIDGKPLYQKTYSGQTPSTANINDSIILDSLFAAINVISIDGVVQTSNAFVQINDSFVAENHIKTWISSDNEAVRCNVGTNMVNLPIILTIKYTKNTD